MNRLVRAELFKLRATNAAWLFTAASLVSTVAVLVVNCVNAHALLQPLAAYVRLQSHDHPAGQIPADFLARLTSEWTLGHNPVTQAATIATSGQLIGLLLTCLLGIVLVTSEFHQQTATSTFLITPRRRDVIKGKLLTAVLVAAAAWLVSTVISLATGAVFLHTQGYGAQLAQWGVIRAVLLNLAAYVVWAVFGVGFGALVRSQLVATVSATVLYLVGSVAATSLFELVNTYVLQKNWVLGLEVIAPSVASTVMISPNATFTGSPAQYVGALVLIGYGLMFGMWGSRALQRRDVG
jgi:ABC-2 type transport system permease protein